MSDRIVAKIVEWMKTQPVWLQEAFHSIQYGNEPEITRLAQLCMLQARGRTSVTSLTAAPGESDMSTSEDVRLLALSDVKGINRLASGATLEFGKENLSVVYGLNGSGKSSYVRLLKTISGAKCAADLLGNVFSDEAVDQSCSVKYRVGSSEYKTQWTFVGGSVDQLRRVDIFDTMRGDLYFDENEVTYEPEELALLSRLINVTELVASKLDEWRKPLPELADDSAVLSAELYQNITTAMGSASFKGLVDALSWTEADKTKMDSLRVRIAEKTPFEKSQDLLGKKRYLDELVMKVVGAAAGLSKERFNGLLQAKRDATTKTEVAKTAADRLFSESAKLKGVGSEVWIGLWEKAKEYAREFAYPGMPYPNEDAETRCVLCHQTLDADARRRMLDFEGYIKGAAQKDAKLAQAALGKVVEALPIAPNESELKKSMSAAGIVDATEQETIRSFYRSVEKRRKSFDTALLAEDVSPLDDMADWITQAQTRSKSLEAQAKALLQDASRGDDGRSALTAELNGLRARKWLYEHKPVLRRRHLYVRHNAEIDKAIRLTSTKKISAMKSTLADEVVTNAYVKRFDDELKNLSGGRIKVSLAKSRVLKGKVLHKLGMGTQQPVKLKAVLSEGESRVVSLAAFLADSEGNQVPAPFVFDDPISSLDQDYEESVVRRLIALSEKRQVIVFTHRLSMLGAFEHYLKNSGIKADYTAIRDWDGSTGVVTDLFMNESKIGPALNKLVGERLAQCRKYKANRDLPMYEALLKSMCSDFRTLIERAVESDLLCGVVQRYTRPVYTQKIPKLAHLKESDWKLLHNLMTKYSGFEHSQPLEALVWLPEPDEFKSDVDSLIAWRAEYRKQIK